MRNGWLVRKRQPVGLLRNELDRVFDDVFGGFWPQESLRGNWIPSLDVSESEEEVTVRAEIPGVDAEDFEISLQDNVLTISGEKKEESEERKGNVYRAERRFGSFRRSILLSDSVDGEKIAADYEKGILTVTLAKSEKALPKKIPVSVKN